MKENVEIIEADLDIADHQETILALIEMYASDPSCNNQPLSPSARQELIPNYR